MASHKYWQLTFLFFKQCRGYLWVFFLSLSKQQHSVYGIITLRPGIPGGPEGPARPLRPKLGKPGAPGIPLGPVHKKSMMFINHGSENNFSLQLRPFNPWNPGGP